MKLHTYTLRDIKTGTRVLMRFDGNVPFSGKRISEGPLGRLARTAPEVKKLADRGAKVILMSHFRRPGGKHVKNLTLKPVANKMSTLIGKKVGLAPGVSNHKAADFVEDMKDGSVVMLENLRFDAREEKNTAAFARELASMADVYVNNAFGVCHRKHASVNAITRYLPHFAGKLLVSEVRELSKSFHKPFILVMGGVKLKTKMPVISKLAPKASAVLLGGGISLPIIAAKHGKSLQLSGKAIAREDVALAKKLLKQFDSQLVLPLDLLVKPSNGGYQEVAVRDLQRTHEVIDIGSHTQELYRRMLIGAKSVAWNGAMGVVEQKRAQAGTIAVGSAIARLKEARTIVGGGDTVAFIEGIGIGKKFTLLSTGGGAMLAFLAEEKLPGLEPLIEHR